MSAVASELYELMWKTVAEVPRGRVATYGQIARLAGYPHHSRFVSKAMAAAPVSMQLPWHRILNAQGKSSLNGELQELQRERLAQEGVDFIASKVDLKQNLWNPVLDGMLQEWIAHE